MSYEQRIINRARALMENGKARSWSHALDKARELSQSGQPTTTTTKQR